jgi:hypothetical protein
MVSDTMGVQEAPSAQSLFFDCKGLLVQQFKFVLQFWKYPKHVQISKEAFFSVTSSSTGHYKLRMCETAALRNSTSRRAISM